MKAMYIFLKMIAVTAIGAQTGIEIGRVLQANPPEKMQTVDSLSAAILKDAARLETLAKKNYVDAQNTLIEAKKVIAEAKKPQLEPATFEIEFPDSQMMLLYLQFLKDEKE